MCTTSKRIQTNITNTAKNIDWSKVGQGALNIAGALNFSEGVQDISYRLSGDSKTQATDTVFGGKETTYTAFELTGDILTGVGMAKAATTVAKGATVTGKNIAKSASYIR